MYNNLYFLDTETTDKDTSRARLVEVAIQYYDDEKKLVSLSDICNPQTPITIGAMATHHIRKDMVDNKPKFNTTESYRFLMDNPEAILVAHNAPFDIAILKNEGFTIKNSIDTLRVARHILGDDPKIESFSLQYLRYYLDLDSLYPGELTDRFAHSASYDTTVLRWLFLYIAGRVKKLTPTKDIISELSRLSRERLLYNNLAFGKYRGKSYQWVGENDSGYLMWLLNEELKKPTGESDLDLINTCQFYTSYNRDYVQKRTNEKVREQYGK